MSALRALLFLPVSAVLVACHVGPQVDVTNTSIIHAPHGANVVVELTRIAKGPRSEYEGELLELGDEGIVMLVQGNEQEEPQIILIPWNRVYKVGVDSFTGGNLPNHYSGDRRKTAIDNLRNVSRFPQGLSDELTSRLLAHYGQTAVGTID